MNRITPPVITPPVRTARLHATCRVLPGVGPSGPTVVLKFSPALAWAPSGLDYIQFASAVAKVGALQSPIEITRS